MGQTAIGTVVDTDVTVLHKSDNLPRVVAPFGLEELHIRSQVATATLKYHTLSCHWVHVELSTQAVEDHSGEQSPLEIIGFQKSEARVKLSGIAKGVDTIGNANTNSRGGKVDKEQRFLRTSSSALFCSEDWEAILPNYIIVLFGGYSKVNIKKPSEQLKTV